MSASARAAKHERSSTPAAARSLTQCVGLDRLDAMKLDHSRAVMLMVVVTLLWSTAGVVTRQLEQARSFEITFWRSFFTVISLLIILPLFQGRAVFTKLIGFSNFGFPKAHSAAFAVLAYQSAWLRRHHPAEFLAALINAQPMGFYPPASLVRDAGQWWLVSDNQDQRRFPRKAADEHCHIIGRIVHRQSERL